MTVTERDPVCGMPVPVSTAVELEVEGRRLRFCSTLCRDAYALQPVPGPVAPAPRIAYFTMEVALDPRWPTYSGGLGVLAGDMLRACADLAVPVVGVSLVHRHGYFRQHLKPDGSQTEEPAPWKPEDFLPELRPRVEVRAQGLAIAVRAFLHEIPGERSRLPVLLLDTDLPENQPLHRQITHALYGGDPLMRLLQELVLGLGGLRLLRAAGYAQVDRLHLNEGHASFAALGLLLEKGGQVEDVAWVRNRCVFTTHTSVPAGHDRFDYDLAGPVLGATVPTRLVHMLAGPERLDMSRLGLNLSSFVNGVARSHQQVSEAMFPGYEVQQVTNGVHSATWTTESFQRLYDAHLPHWRSDPSLLRRAAQIPIGALRLAHREAKTALRAAVEAATGLRLADHKLTLGFARRATGYKRAPLVFRDLERLRRISRRYPLQLVFAGKAHPRDESGKDAIRQVHAAARALGDEVPVAFVEEYDLALAQKLVAGVDLWLNTPLRPLEASGTSGMKAAHNGVPSLSVLDGWWLEGHVEGVTGWAIGRAEVLPPAEADAADAASLYDKLERVIAPLFYDDPSGWATVMRSAIALNASFFNAHRMVQQYAANAYLR